MWVPLWGGAQNGEAQRWPVVVELVGELARECIEYFPIRIHRWCPQNYPSSADLRADGHYLFCYHPARFLSSVLRGCEL
jgi:hypothetical protein